MTKTNDTQSTEQIKPDPQTTISTVTENTVTNVDGEILKEAQDCARTCETLTGAKCDLLDELIFNALIRVHKRSRSKAISDASGDGNSFAGGVASMARNCIPAFQLVQSGRWDTNKAIEWLNAVISNDTAFLQQAAKEVEGNRRTIDEIETGVQRRKLGSLEWERCATVADETEAIAWADRFRSKGDKTAYRAVKITTEVLS